MGEPMLLRLFFLISFFFGGAAQAMDMGLAVGYRLNDGKSSSTPAQTVDGEGSLQVGGLIYAPIADRFEFRSGFMYTQRHYTVANTSVELSYLDVPLTVMAKLADYGGIFAGVNLGLKAGEDCGGSDCQETESMVTPITFGGFFKFAPQVAVEVFYELQSGEIIQGLEDTTAVGANAVITFD